MLSPDEQWIGVLRENNGGLAAGWIGHDWVNSPGGTGAEGWNLRQGDQVHVADIDGDGSQELIVLSPDEQWIGVLRENNGGLAAGWIGHDWVQPPVPQSTLLAGTLDPRNVASVEPQLLRPEEVRRRRSCADDHPRDAALRICSALSADQPWVAQAEMLGEIRAFVRLQ